MSQKFQKSKKGQYLTLHVTLATEVDYILLHYLFQI